MRILRGQSNLEVSSKGFALFVVGLVLATFVGGAVRTALSSEQVHKRIVAELKNRFPKHEFQVGQTEVLLSRGIWPGLGLRVSGLTFKQDVCGKLSFVLTMPQAVLPLNLLSLIGKGTVRLQDVEVNGGELHLDYHDCPPRAPPSVQAGAATAAGVPAVTLRKTISTPKFDWATLAKYMDGIELKNFIITYEKNPTWKLDFSSAYMALGSELGARATVEVEKSLPFGSLSHPVQLELHGEGNVLQWAVNADFKEGNIHFAGSVDTANDAAMGSLRIRQVPIKDLMSELYQMGLVEHDLKLKATWLSCTAKWEGRLPNYTDMPLGIRDCRVEGGYGRAELAQADWWMGAGEPFKVPAHLSIIQLQIGPVVEALNRQVLPAVLSHLGVWSGNLNFKAVNSWQLDGNLENAEIVFANQSLHGKQVIDRAHTSLTVDSGKVQGKVDDLHLHDGEFGGNLQFDLKDDWRSGIFRVAIEKLQLSPVIQKLLLGGSIGVLAGKGEGSLLNGELEHWGGEFSLPEAHGEGWRVDGVNLRTNFRNGAFHLDGSAKSLDVDANWTLYAEAKLAWSEPPEQIYWRDLSAKVDILKTGGSLHSLSAIEMPKARVWKARGGWVRDAEFAGSMTVGGGKTVQAFALRGEKGGLSVEENIAGSQ